MTPAAIRVVLSIGAILFGATAGAQPVYRCGNTYGSQPCLQGRVLEPDDARSVAQREEALRIVAAQKRQGDDMEHDRLRREAALKPALASALSSAPAPATKSAEKKPLPKKRASKPKASGKQVVVFELTIKTGNRR